MSDDDKVVASIEDQIATKITSVLDDLVDGGRLLSLAEGIEKLSGLPNEFVPVLTAVLAAKESLDLELVGTKSFSSFAFNLIVSGAAIGYAEGRRIGRSQVFDAVSDIDEAIAEIVRNTFARKATADANAASKPDTTDLEGRLATGADFPS